MPHIDARSGEVVIRIVYDGAPEAGKTTNVAKLGSLMSLQRLGAAKKPGTTGDRTEFFDWLDFAGGYLDGCRVRCQLVSVPGQSRLLHRRRYLLEKADAIVFVADSRPPSFGDSIQNFATTVRMVEQLAGPIPVGVILQANKQDLPEALSPLEVAKHIGTSAAMPVIGSVASRGDGVMQTFILAVRLATERVRQLLIGDDLAAMEDQSDSPEALFAAMLELEKKMVANAGEIPAGIDAAPNDADPPTIEIVPIDDDPEDVVADVAIAEPEPIPPMPAVVRTAASAPGSIEHAARRAAQTRAMGLPPLPPPPPVRSPVAAARLAAALVQKPTRHDPLEDELEAAWDHAALEIAATPHDAAATIREQAAREQERLAREVAAREQERLREQATRKEAQRLREQEREQAAREQEREQAEREQAEREQAAREQAEREQAQAARAQAAREEAAREQERLAEQAAREQEQAAREQAAREEVARAQERLAREQAARDEAARAQAAREQAQAAEQAARLANARRNPLGRDTIPTLPNAAEIASGHVWPPVKGRASVAIATSGRISVPEMVQPWAPADAFEIVSEAGWLLHSTPRWLFESESVARHRLLGYVRGQISRGGGIPEGRTLAVAKDGERWRLWLLTPLLEPLSLRIVAALDGSDAAATSLSFKEVLAALRELRELGSSKEIAAGMSGLALHERRLAVLPLDEADGEPHLEPRDPFAELVQVIHASVPSNAGLRRWYEDEGRLAIERASAL